jgi:hypothetical protein
MRPAGAAPPPWFHSRDAYSWRVADGPKSETGRFQVADDANHGVTAGGRGPRLRAGAVVGGVFGFAGVFGLAVVAGAATVVGGGAAVVVGGSVVGAVVDVLVVDVDVLEVVVVPRGAFAVVRSASSPAIPTSRADSITSASNATTVRWARNVPIMVEPSAGKDGP